MKGLTVTDEESMLGYLTINPDDAVARLVYADWLDERDRHDEATEERFVAASKRCVSLEDLVGDYDWAETFGEGTGGNCDNRTDPCPPGSDVDLTPPTRADVVRVLAAEVEFGDYAETTTCGVFKLRDGRYLLAAASCDTTGWDCQAGNELEVSRTIADLLQYGVSDGQRKMMTVSE